MIFIYLLDVPYDLVLRIIPVLKLKWEECVLSKTVSFLAESGLIRLLLCGMDVGSFKLSQKRPPSHQLIGGGQKSLGLELVGNNR